MKTDKQMVSDTSEVTKKNVIVVLVSAALFIALLGFSIYKWTVYGIKQPMEIFINLMFLFVLVTRVQPRYTVEVDRNVLRFIKQSWLGTKTYEIPYKDIFGIYRYKAQLIRSVSYRHTSRLNSMLDNRTVWGVSYRLPNKKGKVENLRIYFKASEEVFAALSEKIPNKVKIKENDVAVAMLQADPDWEKK